MNIKFWLTTILATCLLLTACSAQTDKNNAVQQNSYEIQTPVDEADFLEQAYSLGYTDEQLAHLKNCEVPHDTILNLSASTANGIPSPNSRYILAGYEISFLESCMFLFDTDTNQATVLPDWQNGYADFGFLNEELFFASIPQLGGAVYETGVRVYSVEAPNRPRAVWDLTDSSDDQEKLKTLFNAYPIGNTEMLLVFWCETPKEWGGRVEGDTEKYRITLIDYDCNVIKELTTELLLRPSKTGIAAPNFDKPNAHREPEPDTVYFDIGENMYVFNYKNDTIDEL